MEVGRYGEVYKRLIGADQSVERALVACRRQQVLRSLLRAPHGTVLEIGCALDPLFCHYDTFTKHITIEPVPEFAAKARALAEGRKGVTLIEGFFEARVGELAAESFDVIVASGLLHEVASAGELLASVAKVCRRETLVHLNVPNMRSFHRLLASEMGIIENVFEPSELDRQLGHKAWFDKERLHAVVEENGFEVVEFGTYFVKPLTHSQLEAAMAHEIVSPQILDGLARMIQYMPDLGAEMFADVRLAR
jgi:2-polyprenyl-3-methyl-5-hydroxy-6-metoxy-1,4-benzoquinol methylase